MIPARIAPGQALVDRVVPVSTSVSRLGLIFAFGHTAWTLTSTGVPTIVGPTAGYLFAFPIVGFVVGTLAERGWDRTLARAVPTMALGRAVISILGISWIAHFVRAAHVIKVGLLPFVAGDIVKLLLAAATLPLGWRVLGTRASGNLDSTPQSRAR